MALGYLSFLLLLAPGRCASSFPPAGRPLRCVRRSSLAEALAAARTSTSPGSLGHESPPHLPLACGRCRRSGGDSRHRGSVRWCLRQPEEKP